MMAGRGKYIGVKCLIRLLMALCLLSDLVYCFSRRTYNAQEGICNEPLILTPYIMRGDYILAQRLSKVNLNGARDVESYSGYLTVDTKCNSNLFFWYFPSEQRNVTDPLILWLQGGPGSSSMLGLFNEIGPFQIIDDTYLMKRKYYWSDKRNVLFIDSPVGSGFSFTDNRSECYAHNTHDVRFSLYNALQQFFNMFPKLRENDFYIFGESYAGKYIPALAYTIYENVKKPGFRINLKGLGMGNPFIDPETMLQYSTFLRYIGLLNSNGVETVRKYESIVYRHLYRNDWVNAFNSYLDLLRKIQKLAGSINIYNYLEYNDTVQNTSIYLNRDNVKCSLHTGKHQYSMSSALVYSYFIGSLFKSVKPLVEILLEHYPVMLYSGTLDIVLGTVTTDSFIKRLKWSGASEFGKQKQSKFYTFNSSAPYAYGTQYGNLAFIKIRNAGHYVPHDQPLHAYYIMDDFINGLTHGKVGTLNGRYLVQDTL